MRTQKRFTPSLLERFIRQGRGTGTYQDYIPWHRVGRGDPSSQGRSHLMIWKERQRELLSDGEWDGLAFSTMVSNVIDIREQHQLSLASGLHELALYGVRSTCCEYPGTLELAMKMGVKHPRVTGEGTYDYWKMTTDQVLVLRSSTGQLELLSVAFKPDNKSLTKRKRQLLAIEKAYWDARGVTWILITPEIFEESVGLTLRRTAPWALGTATTEDEKQIAIKVASQTLGHSFSFTLNSIEVQLGNKDLAQRSFWQAVWNGDILMDLRMGWRPHLPIKLLSHEAFVELNPVASRRSSWC